MTLPANLWPLLPIASPEAFALGWAASVGVVGALVAQAVGSRRPLRPALHAVVAVTLLAPPAIAPGAWPALLAAAALLIHRPPRLLRAANDNQAPRRPFALPAPPYSPSAAFSSAKVSA